MARQQKTVSLPLTSILLVCLIIGVYLMTAKRFPKPDPSIKVTKHSVDTSSDETLKYWTQKRMRDARPAQLPHVNKTQHERQDSGM